MSVIDPESKSNADRFLIYAHRGASAERRENTLEAFEVAIEMNADGVEIDVRRTRDDVFVIYHDPTIAGCNTPISELTYADAEKTALADGFHLPTLQETLDLCAGRILLDIELKEAGYEGEVVRLVRDQAGSAGIVFSSFLDSSVKSIKTIVPEFKAGLILGVDPPASFATRFSEFFPLKRLRQCGADFVAPNFRLLKLGFLRRMRSAGYPVWVWTVNDVEKGKWLSASGVMGIITDRPDILRDHS